MNGIDYSTGRPPSMQWLTDQGFGFVCRYLAPPIDDAKVIHKQEYDELRGAGLAVVLNWETFATMMLGGQAAGKADAGQAVMQAQALGAWPCPIYFSADFDASQAQQAAINDYLAGCATVMGSERVGLYGGYWAVKRAFDAGAARYGWQTYAWSGEYWDDRAQLRQVPQGGAWFDEDVAMAADYGQVGGPAPLVRSASGPAQRFVAGQ